VGVGVGMGIGVVVGGARRGAYQAQIHIMNMNSNKSHWESE